MISSAPSGKTRRARGDHSTRVKNPLPGYEVPASHTKRLAFIRDLVSASMERDVIRSDEAMLARAHGTRQKQFYRDRARAIRALHTVFSEHVNLVTHQIEISLRNASDAAGLSTISDNERKKAEMDPHYTPIVSISRASRALKDMVELGWIRADKLWQVWDKEAGAWTDKYFEATELFFNAAGITTERVERQRTARLGYLKNQAIKNGMSPEEAGRMSVNQIRADRRLRWRRRAFERRADVHAKKRLTRQLTGKSREEQRQVAIQNVLTALGDDVRVVDMDTFKELVNREIAALRKYTGVSPPVH